MLLGVASCDSIKEVSPENLQDENVPAINKIALALQSTYPSAKDITITTLAENELWQASFQVTEGFYTSVLNGKGAFLETLRTIENTKELPTKIENFINNSYQNYKINGAFERLKGKENKGYKLMISDSISSSSLVFSTDGDLQLLAAAPIFRGSPSTSMQEINTSSFANATNISVNGSSVDFLISFISIDYDALPEAIKNYFAKVSIIGKFSSAGIQLNQDGSKTYLVSYEDAASLSIFRFDADGNYLDENKLNISNGGDILSEPFSGGSSSPLPLADIPKNILNYLNDNHEGWVYESGFTFETKSGEISSYSINIEVTDELAVSLIRLSFDAEGNFIEPDSGGGINFPIPPDGDTSDSGFDEETNDLEIDPDDIPEKIVAYLNEHHDGWIFMIGFENRNKAFETTGYSIAITFTNEIAVRLQFDADLEIIE